MARMEVSCRRFALFGGMQTDAGAYAVCVQPDAPGLQKRGTLALITEPVGSVALEADACRLAQRAVVEGYFSDHSLGLTGSLLNALDGANNALLQYGAGWAGESPENGPVLVKTRRVKVGMTAVLVRADGTGIYLSQMAPTQAYILHAGLVSALPTPADWEPAPSRTVVSLKRVLSGDDESEAEEDDDAATDLSGVVVPAASLGSAPGIEADLIYRRVAPGDKIILVSSGLARCIDRQWADETFTYDVDSITEALSDLAQEQGLAEAHACVIELGVPVSSGVDSDFMAPITAKPGIQVAHEGGATSLPHFAAPKTAPSNGGGASLLDALKGPREWFGRRKSEPEAAAPLPYAQPTDEGEFEPPAPVAFEQYRTEGEAPSIVEAELWQEADDEQSAPPPAPAPSVETNEDEFDLWSSYPTQLFVQSSPQVPPYKSQVESEAQPAQGDLFDEELQFDGWEDNPPALDDPRYGSTHRVIFKPKVVDSTPGEDMVDMYGFSGANALDSAPEYASTPTSAPRPLASVRNKKQSFNLRRVADNVLAWGGQAFAAVLPPKNARTRGASSNKKMQLPVRIVILGVMAVVVAILALSLLNMRGSAEKAATNGLLTEAQQLQTAANQSGISDTERLEKLQLALNKAKEAAAEDPKSDEAKRLVEKLSADLDSAQGVTRLASLKLLFDLDVIDNAGSAAPSAADAAPTTSNNDVLAQGNDLYVLDRAQSRIYRCQVAAKACTSVLSKGDAIGGETMGAPIAMTLRVGSPVVLDDRLVSYVFTADSGAWTAERLGGADGLQAPSQIASYDGNLYLLGSKAGQVLKYPSGQYAGQPIEWISDAATVQAMHEPSAIAIDGLIYVALKDGTILAMQGGKMATTFSPKTAPGSGPPTQLFTTPDTHDIYELRADEGSIMRISKEGQTIYTLKAPGDSDITSLNNVAVDEGRNVIYITSNRKVYQASLPSTNPKANTSTQPAAAEQQAPLASDKPAVKPTVEP